MEQEKLLSIENLVVQYVTDDGVVEAVNGINFDIKPGENLGLVGETGAGKTTTALSIMRLVPDPPGIIKKGEIYFNGKNLLKESKIKMRRYRGKEISMIFQDPMTSLNPVMKVGQQISEVIRLHEKLSKVDAYKRTAEILEMVGIPSDRMNEYPHQFSGGMKQRVVIAIALACTPQLIIADEPTTALDVTIQAQVLELINNLQRKISTSLLLITHNLGIIAEICDRVAIMYSGNILEIGSLEDIYENTKHPYTKGLFNSLPTLSNKVKRLKPIKGLMPDPTNLPKGCPFAPRCEEKRPECEFSMPHFTETSNGHLVRCVLYQ